MAEVKASASSPQKPGQQPAPKTAKRPPQFRIESSTRKTRYLKLLVYGNFGVGKTTLAASAVNVPQMRDVIVINAEAGDLSLTGMDIDTIPVTNFRALGEINEYLKQHCKARDEDNVEFLKLSEATLRGCEPEEIENPRRYRTVIIDSLTEIESYCFNQLLGVTDTTRLDEEVQGAEWAEYKKNHAMMLRVVRAFRDLPMHVIFTAAEQFTQDETKKMKYTPSMTGKLSKSIQGFMDMVGYYAMGRNGDNIERRLYVLPSPTGRYDAKHRYQAFKNEFFTNPSIGSILKDVGLLEEGGAPLK